MQKPPSSKDERGNLPWYHPGSTTVFVVALCKPSNKGSRGNGRTRRGLSEPAGSVRPLDSQATFGGGRCEGLQPVTLFSFPFRGLARADPAYSSCSLSFRMRFVIEL